jgi:hypothetical protein
MLVYTSVILGLISAALFLLAAFKVALGSVELGWLAACFLALAVSVPGLVRRAPP